MRFTRTIRWSIVLDTLMTLEEVAAYLRLSRDTVYRMVQSGKIPASKVGTQWRFRKKELDGWLEANKNLKIEKSKTESIEEKEDEK